MTLSKELIFCVFFFTIIHKNIYAQLNCLPVTDNFRFEPTPASVLKTIDWKKFPEFSLPFEIVYNGPRFNDNERLPLRYGFTHLASFNGSDKDLLPVKNRAIIYYGVAYSPQNPQPWELIRSPWGNDLQSFEFKWLAEMRGYADLFTDSQNTDTPKADILMLDIERHWDGEFEQATNRAILGIKTDKLVPTNYSQLSDANFINRYKKDMQKLYALPLDVYRRNGWLNGFRQLSSYGDVPITYKGFNIEGNSWQNWTTNSNLLSYLMVDTLTNQKGGPFYNQLGYLSPSCYVQKEYAANPKAQGGNYLAEALFQIEVNRAWSAKDLQPFVWLRTEDFTTSGPRWIKPYQAEAFAIFPFMCGAKKLWLWEDPGTWQSNDNYASYEHFIYGLYRLSLYKRFFEGNNELVIPTPARDLYVNQLPVWRAVVKNDEILIAAANPYASENETTKIEVSYKDWKNTITLTGREVHLCSYKLVKITAEEPNNTYNSMKILGNPIINNQIKLDLNTKNFGTINYKIYTKIGKEIATGTTTVDANKCNIPFANKPAGMYILQVLAGKEKYQLKFINN